MIGAIPNPTRELTVQFSNEQVQTAMSNLSKYLIGSGVGNYIQHQYDGVIGQLELVKTEFLSLGVSIMVNSNAISDNQSKINIEVRRQVGAFDQSYEVSEARRHLDKVVSGLSTLLQTPEVADQFDIKEVAAQSEKQTNKSVLVGALVFGLILLAVML
jgi:hypothetical protein